jgi:hypothetical protein
MVCQGMTLNQIRRQILDKVKSTLYEQVKDALRSGAPPEQVAAIFGVSVETTRKIEAVVRNQSGISDLLETDSTDQV